ncbi:hypothetical protein I350_00012 [Cryptococcus amylolentus CBS 6273]|uniref:Ricin B lectin domain-containing protein n=1 Tax=Cryptococcus amylolentus CBS 6273 TaxID=1296118 RepID=A0A1E3KF68_9TREE|nr:hypothetical protein I350_00012 [Cryptococcus amylolentus CBS 6273]
MFTKSLFLSVLLFFSATNFAQPTRRTIYKRLSGVKIQSGHTGKCLVPDGGRDATAGAQISTVDCTDHGVGHWDMDYGSGQVVLTSTVGGDDILVMDAGTGKDNGESLTVEKYSNGTFAQTWYLTTDNRIAITDGDECMEMDDYDKVITNPCEGGDTNQVWWLLAGDDASTLAPPDSTSAEAASSTTSGNADVSTTTGGSVAQSSGAATFSSGASASPSNGALVATAGGSAESSSATSSTVSKVTSEVSSSEGKKSATLTSSSVSSISISSTASTTTSNTASSEENVTSVASSDKQESATSDSDSESSSSAAPTATTSSEVDKIETFHCLGRRRCAA